MSDDYLGDLVGDIVIKDNTVEFSDGVGHTVTDDQVALLHRVAERLGKCPVNDRYPANPVFADATETIYGAYSRTSLMRMCGRNEHGVPKQMVWESQLRFLNRKNGTDY